jgi:tetratricopeptide (TPR) repeat protein
MTEMFRFVPTLLGVLLLCPSPSGAESTSAKTFLDQARAAYEKRHDHAQARQAVELYGKAIEAGAGYPALWEGARAAAHLGASGMPRARRGAKRAIFKRGVDWARLATKAHPNGAEGHLYLAITMGHHAKSQSFLHQMGVAGDIRREAAKAVKLNPAAECGTPLRVLGMYYLRLPEAFGGDDARALKLLSRAAKICPNDPDTHLDYAEALEENGQKAKAIGELEWVLAHPPSSPADRAGYRQTKVEAERRLKRLR